MRPPLIRFAACCFCLTLVSASVPMRADAMEQVTFRKNDQQHFLQGKVVVKAQDGGLLLMTPAGELWTIEPDQIISHTQDDVPFEPANEDALAESLLKELPDGFEVYRTEHYLIVHNASRAYATWCGALFERLYWAFNNYWDRKGFDLHEPEFPLVAVVFGDRQSYANYARPEVGDAVENIIGYYSLRSNRMTMYDLTGVASLRRPGNQRTTAAQINAMLAQPQAEQTVATVIHEATHQIALNCGLQTRYADIPLWVSEGIAVYFETPDLSSSRGWRTIGGVNSMRLRQLRHDLPSRAPGSLVTLLADDKRFRDPRTAVSAYAEAWALNYFLINQYPRQFVDYLQKLAKKEPLLWDEPEQRLQEFRDAFGDIDELEQQMLRFVSRLR